MTSISFFIYLCVIVLIVYLRYLFFFHRKKLLTSSQIDFYKKNGVLVVKNVVPKKLIKKLISELERFIDLEIKNKDLKSLNITRNGDVINSIHFLAQIKGYLFNQIFEKTLIDKYASQLLGGTAFFQVSESFLKPAFLGKKVYQHQDNEYYCLTENLGLNVITALDDARLENGTLYYYFESHKLGPLHHKSLATKTYTVDDIKLKNYEKTFIELKAGDCVFHHSLVVHGSEENHSPYQRRTITRLYSPYKIALQDDKINLRIKKAFEEIFAD